MKTAIELIAEERVRQISVEGWTPEHDDKHSDGSLATAAACYALEPLQVVAADAVIKHRCSREFPDTYLADPHVGPHQVRWPWEAQWYKRTSDDRVRELVKAGALISAEIDRLQRVANTQGLVTPGTGHSAENAPVSRRHQ